MTDHNTRTGPDARNRATGDSHPVADGGARIGRSMGSTSLSAWRSHVRSREEAEQRYVATRDAWTAAMKAANSGRPADLAALAIAQEAYEAASAERDRWHNGSRVAIPVEPAVERTPIDIVVGQELAWRQVHRTEDDEKQSRGLVGRLFGRRKG